MSKNLRLIFMIACTLMAILFLTMWFQAQSANRVYEAERALHLSNIHRLQLLSDSVQVEYDLRHDSLLAGSRQIDSLRARVRYLGTRMRQTVAQLDEVLEAPMRNAVVDDTLAARLALDAWRIRSRAGN